jgi:HEAT repeat protein
MRTTSDPIQCQEARAAIRHIGTNAIPVLLEWLQCDDRPTPTQRLLSAKQSSIQWLEAHRIIKARSHSSRPDPRGCYRCLAYFALEELGPEAAPAIPSLIQFLALKARTTNELHATAGAAFVALGKLAPASIPPLIAALSTPDDQVWALAAGALSQMGTQASIAIPAVRPRLQDPNPMFRVSAAEVMGKLGADPRQFMPVLIQTLHEPPPDMLTYKLDVLLQYKEHAAAAVPILQEILGGIPNSGSISNTSLHAQILNVIRQINPATAPIEQ